MADGAEAGVDATDREVGERLRRVRTQQGRSLHGVEVDSGGRIKASVLGAYERGERGLSLTRLQQLADFYRVPVHELLPDTTPEEPIPDRPAVVIDLVALEGQRERLPVLARYIDGVRSMRGDYHGRVLTVRSNDLRALAAAEGTTPDELRTRIEAIEPER